MWFPKTISGPAMFAFGVNPDAVSFTVPLIAAAVGLTINDPNSNGLKSPAGIALIKVSRVPPASKSGITPKSKVPVNTWEPAEVVAVTSKKTGPGETVLAIANFKLVLAFPP